MAIVRHCPCESAGPTNAKRWPRTFPAEETSIGHQRSQSTARSPRTTLEAHSVVEKEDVQFLREPRETRCAVHVSQSAPKQKQRRPPGRSTQGTQYRYHQGMDQVFQGE